MPKGWSSVKLKELVSAQKGKKPDVLRKSHMAGFVPYFDIHAIEKNKVRQFAEVKSSRLATENDLFVVWDGARSGWVGSGISGAVGSTIMALTPRQVASDYLKHFIAGQFQTINTSTRGAGIPHVDPEVFWSLEVPLAPISEQRCIVAKLEKLLGKAYTCEKRLAKIPVILKRFRQAVLAAACSGRLTADWREKNAPGRVSNVGAGPCACPDLNDVQKKGNHIGLPLQNTGEGLPDIPETWQWVKLPNTGEMNRGKSRHRPRNAPFLFGGSHPFIQTGDISQSGSRITAHTQTYSDAELAQSRLWPAGTICITIAANIAESLLLTYPACFPSREHQYCHIK